MDINNIRRLCGAGFQASPKLNGDKGFREIFDRKTAEVNSTETLTAERDKADALEHGNRILNLLDDYARVLGDPEKTLKHIEPLIENIKNEADLIENITAGKIQNDSELKRFIEDVAITANVAAFKFNRGDYV